MNNLQCPVVKQYSKQIEESEHKLIIEIEKYREFHEIGLDEALNMLAAHIAVPINARIYCQNLLEKITL